MDAWPFKRMCPVEKPIYYLINKVKRTGSVEDMTGRGKTKTVDTPENSERILNYVNDFRNASVSEMATELLLSKTFVQKILNQSGYHAYKICNVPILKPTDLEQRTSFATWYFDLKQQTNDVI